MTKFFLFIFCLLFCSAYPGSFPVKIDLFYERVTSVCPNASSRESIPPTPSIQNFVYFPLDCSNDYLQSKARCLVKEIGDLLNDYKKLRAQASATYPARSAEWVKFLDNAEPHYEQRFKLLLMGLKNNYHATNHDKNTAKGYFGEFNDKRITKPSKNISTIDTIH